MKRMTLQETVTQYLGKGYRVRFNANAPSEAERLRLEAEYEAMLQDRLAAADELKRLQASPASNKLEIERQTLALDRLIQQCKNAYAAAHTSAVEAGTYEFVDGRREFKCVVRGSDADELVAKLKERNHWFRRHGASAKRP